MSRPLAERLEGRRLLAYAAQIVSRTLVINGGPNADRLTVSCTYETNDREVADLTAVTIVDADQAGFQAYNVANFDRVRIDLDAGSDLLDLSVRFVRNAVEIDLPDGVTFDATKERHTPISVDAGGGRDSVLGSPFADLIRGGDDGDYLSAAGGDDTVYGEAGDDTLTGGAGRNRIYGGEGTDRLGGSNGRDFLYGEGGDDRLYGQAGNDYLDGGGGRDRAYGGDGADSMIGGSGIDRLYGDGGDDSFVGGPGNDYLFGGGGDDDDRVADAGDILDGVEA